MKGAIVVEYVNRCIKFNLPDGRTLDLLFETLNKMVLWKQEELYKPEGCGFLLGYRNCKTKNITISDITMPQDRDYRLRFFCKILDKIHFRSLKQSAKKSNYYMGVWHTHPQNIPVPSDIDWAEWSEILKKDQTGDKYILFIIIGMQEFRIWVGDFDTKIIVEIFESASKDGIYQNGV